jgi:hypothetical protein
MARKPVCWLQSAKLLAYKAPHSSSRHTAVLLKGSTTFCCSEELGKRGLTVDTALASQDQALLADLDRWLLCHIVPEMPYETTRVYSHVREPLRSASQQGDMLDVHTVGTWP